MTNPKEHHSKKISNAHTGVNGNPAPTADDRTQHEDETLGNFLGNRDPGNSPN